MRAPGVHGQGSPSDAAGAATGAATGAAGAAGQFKLQASEIAAAKWIAVEEFMDQAPYPRDLPLWRRCYSVAARAAEEGPGAVAVAAAAAGGGAGGSEKRGNEQGGDGVVAAAAAGRGQQRILGERHEAYGGVAALYHADAGFADAHPHQDFAK
jgi:hypothetical protein